MPHNFMVGEECWLIVGGEDNHLANCHVCTVTAIGDDGEYSVIRPGWIDEYNDLENPPIYEDVKVHGLSQYEGVFTSKKVIDGEGNGLATLSRMDSDFRDGGFDDMADICHLNDAELARNLRLRATMQPKQPYCRCGATLVAINIYEPRESYDPGGVNEVLWATDESLTNPEFKTKMTKSTEQVYRDQQTRSSEKPHPWSLASHCYKEVFEPRKGAGQNDQFIVLTGESGAGKTFTTMKILDYLASVGGGEGATGEQVEQIVDLMLSATPILEGFGNANMLRNPDSSRFGKLYKIFLDEADKSVTGRRFPYPLPVLSTLLFSGCTITPYLLEKSRMSAQQMNERNFHIFYQMLCQPVTSENPEKDAEKAVLFDGSKLGFSVAEKAQYVAMSCLMCSCECVCQTVIRLQCCLSGIA